MDSEIIHTVSGQWCTRGALDNWRKMWHHFEKIQFLYSEPEMLAKRKQRGIAKEDNRKWAYVIVGKTKKMVWVDNKTLKAYKPDGYNKTWMEIKRFTFERWCTTMDL